MKIAIISDIHWNAVALTAVLSDIKKNNIDSIICLGDVATLGPSPKEVIDILRDLNCPCILWNHEEALFNPEKAENYDIKWKLLKSALYWCLNKLEPKDIDFLKKFKSTISIKLENGKKLLCYHWSPNSTTGSIYSDSTHKFLDKTFNKDDMISIAIWWHTHIQILKQYNKILVVNPGSVWCPFDKLFQTSQTPSILPIAQYAIINNDKTNTYVELKQVEYDISKYVSIIKNSDNPLKEWWINEYKRLGY